MILLKKDIFKQLADLFNLFLSGSFSFILKTAKVMLVFQKGSKLGFWKYRPIPFLSNVEKILEKLMYKRVNSFLTEKKHYLWLAVYFQTKMLYFLFLTENTRQTLDEACIWCDISAYFRKLLSQWIMKYFYLNLITMVFKLYQIHINGYGSGISEITGGVLQGSSESPLFLLYMNDPNQAI